MYEMIGPIAMGDDQTIELNTLAKRSGFRPGLQRDFL